MKLKIFIIEDENIVALDIKRIMLSLGHNVLKIAKTAQDAFCITEKLKPDLIISDINLQGDMDGIECCKILQSRYDIPVIFITAYKDIETLKRVSSINFAGYLVKPFREDELVVKVNLAIIKNEQLAKKDKQVLNDRYSYSFKTKELFLNDEPIYLAKKEQYFLELLIKANGTIVPYYTIEHTIWHGEFVQDTTRRQLIHRFKQKAPDFPFELVKNQGVRLICKI